MQTMRFLVVIMTVLALATAKTPYGRPNDDDVQIMVMSSSSHYTNMLGNCTVENFAYSTVACLRAFFLSVRINKTAPCESKFQLYKTCSIDQFKKCYEKTVSEF